MWEQQIRETLRLRDVEPEQKNKLSLTRMLLQVRDDSAL